jgi:hypothetical protein
LSGLSGREGQQASLSDKKGIEWARGPAACQTQKKKT